MYCGGCTNVVLIVVAVLTTLILFGAPYWSLITAVDSHNVDSNKFLAFTQISMSVALEDGDLISRIVVILGALLLTIVAFTREIQLRVIFERNNMYGCFKIFLNVVGALSLILSSLGIITAVVVSLEINELVHDYAAVVGTTGIVFYSWIHIILTIIERYGCFHEYPSCIARYIEIVYFILTSIISTVFFSILGLYQLEHINGNTNAKMPWNLFEAHWDINERYFYQWVGYWIIISQFLLFGILFARNPANDELHEFFMSCRKCRCCCCCCGYECGCGCGCLSCCDKDNQEKDSMQMGIVTNSA